jgi:hypothetical protein
LRRKTEVRGRQTYSTYIRRHNGNIGRGRIKRRNENISGILRKRVSVCVSDLGTRTSDFRGSEVVAPRCGCVSSMLLLLHLQGPHQLLLVLPPSVLLEEGIALRHTHDRDRNAHVVCAKRKAAEVSLEAALSSLSTAVWTRSS